MRKTLRPLLPLFLLIGGLAIGGSRVSFGQAMNAGDIRGQVTDPSGALVPEVTVTVLNLNTGVTKTFTTNNDGLYDTSSIVTGRYQVTFAKSGFESLIRGPITIDVGYTTVNGQLKVGAASVQVTVTSDVPLLNTESGDQTATLEDSSMAQLPQVGTANNSGNSWENFIVLLPGTSGTAGGAQGSASPGQEPSSNGNMPFTNVLEDGASTTLPASQNANPAVFDDLQEVQVSLSSFSAQYGVGGLIINQITKGGTDKFHGSAYEYFDNNALNAAPFGFGNKQTVPFLRYDDFGGTIGGPVAIPRFRKKAFFFFGYDQIVNNGNSTGYQTVPTANVLAGNFTGGYTVYDPTTQIIAYDVNGNPYPVRKSFQSEYGSNAIPASMIDSVSKAFEQYYPTGSNSVGHFVNGTLLPTGVLQNNWYDSYAVPRPWHRYFGRFDYDITPNNRLTMSDNQGDEGENGDNAVTPCPVACQLGDVDNNNAEITDVWNISPNTINEARMGYTDQLNFFSDSTTGKNYPQTLGWAFAKANILPAVQFNRNYPYAWIQPATNAEYKEFTFDPSDVVTMIRGKHILHFGGEFAFYRDDATPWGNINGGTLVFNGSYTENWVVETGAGQCGAGAKIGVACPNTSSGEEYADFLLGYADNWSAGYTPEFGARLKKPQMFVQDDWKLSQKLTLNLGVRYEINHGFNEITGNEATFDPTVKNDDGTLGAYWYGSTHANGRGSLQANVFSTVMPRLGFSWLARPNTTVRGGFGLYSYNFSLDNYGSGMGAAVSSSGGFGDQSNGIYPVTKFSGNGTLFPLGGGTAAPLPYTSASTDPGRFNGQGGSYNKFHTPIPKIWQWNFGVDRELGANMVVTLSYVGSHGFNLTFPTSLNAIPENDLSSNDTQFRPYLNYQAGGLTGNLYQAISNYNSLQAEIKKRTTHGLTFDFNYVWSHMLDDQDSSGWGSHAGSQVWQHASTLTLNQASLNYGPSNFDERQAFKGYVVYELPFGKGKMFLNSNALADQVVGGWQISGTVLELAGNPFQPTGPGSLYTHAGTQFLNRVPGVSLTPSGGKSWRNWFNEAAFSQPAVGAFGTAQRNPLVGPGINEFDLSAGKEFSIWENVKFQLRCDATNAFNHPSFGAIAEGNNGNFGLTGGGAGLPFSGTSVLSAVSVGGRDVQLSGRISF
ncbi:MAG TPA: TonB-dependent receptor [Terracidiphilus sp.]|nr:TonB-dependent receptor [Terracidiphilus sp.]